MEDHVFQRAVVEGGREVRRLPAEHDDLDAISFVRTAPFLVRLLGLHLLSFCTRAAKRAAASACSTLLAVAALSVVVECSRLFTALVKGGPSPEKRNR